MYSLFERIHISIMMNTTNVNVLHQCWICLLNLFFFFFIILHVEYFLKKEKIMIKMLS